MKGTPMSKFICSGLFIWILFFGGSRFEAQEKPTLPTVHLEIISPTSAQSGFFRATLPQDLQLSPTEIETARGKDSQIFAIFSDPTTPQISYLGRFHQTEEITLYLRLKTGTIQEFKASLQSATPSHEPQALEKAWARALLNKYATKANQHHSSFYQYAAMVTARKYGLEKELQRIDQNVNVFNNPFRTTPDLYSVFTGAAAIQETLQLDAMRQVQHVAEVYNLPAKELQGPTIESHPFGKMLEGRKFQRFPLAKIVPPDFYYLHATSIQSLLMLTEEGKEWGTHFLRHYLTSGRDILLKEKYQDQLNFKVNPFLRPFYSMVVNSVAVVGSDLYVTEGSDITMLFDLKQPQEFREKFESYRDSFQRAYPEAQKNILYYGNFQIETLITAQRELSSYLVYPRRNLAIVSNSLVALHKILDTYSEKTPSLHDTEEFKYIRSVFPAGKETESVFIYLSDPFIRNLVGPKSKILEQRRVRVVNTLEMIQNAALLHLLEKGKLADSLSNLVQEGYLQEHYLLCPFGGTYTLENGITPVSSVLGTQNFLTPISELPFETISAREKQEYRRFLSDYNNYWREFFDPIGVRILFQNGLKVETIILPLINNSLYQNLPQMIGSTPVELPAGNIPDKTIFLTRFFGKSLLEEMLKSHRLEALFQPLKNQKKLTAEQVINAFGDTITLGLVDHQMIFGFNVSGEIAQSIRRGGRWNQNMMFLTPLIASLNLPIFASIPVKDSEVVQSFLEKFTEYYAQKMMSRQGNPFLVIDPYQVKMASGKRYGVIRASLFNSITVRLYYGMDEQRFYLSSHQKVLENLLEPRESAPTLEAPVANLCVDLFPKHYEKVLDEFQLAWSESSREACLRNTDSLQMYVDIFGKYEGSFSKLAQTLENVHYYCPGGGQYVMGPEGFASCSFHHYRFAPEQPASLPSLSPLQKANKISLQFQFIPEGLYTVLQIEKK